MFAMLRKRLAGWVAPGSWLNANAHVAIATLAAVVLSFLLLATDDRLTIAFPLHAGTARPSGRFTDLVVAYSAVPQGTVLKPSDVTVVRISEDAFPKYGVHRVEEVLDRSLYVRPLAAGEPIFETDLAPRGSGNGIAPLVPEGMRAVTVKVDDVGALVGFLMPGHHVDVFATETQAGNTRTFLCTQNAEILAAGTSTQRRYYSTDSKIDKPPPTFTLLVSLDQAQALIDAAARAKLTFALRNTIDRETVGPPAKDSPKASGHTR